MRNPDSYCIYLTKCEYFRVISIVFPNLRYFDDFESINIILNTGTLKSNQ